MTGHARGVITLNSTEANDSERERQRHAMGEPYRTLLGHFRHEVEDRITQYRARPGSYAGTTIAAE